MQGRQCPISHSLHCCQLCSVYNEPCTGVPCATQHTHREAPMRSFYSLCMVHVQTYIDANLLLETPLPWRLLSATMNSMLFAGEPITSATLCTMFEEQTEVFDNSDGYIVDPNYPGKLGFYCLNALVDQMHYKESANILKLFFDSGNNASTSTLGASSSNSQPQSTCYKCAAWLQPYTHNCLPLQESGVVPMSGSASTQPSYIPGVNYPQGPPSSAQLSYISDVSHLQGPPPSTTYGFTPGMSLQFIALSQTYHTYCTQILLTLFMVLNSNSTCLAVATHKVLLLAQVKLTHIMSTHHHPLQMHHPQFLSCTPYLICQIKTFHTCLSNPSHLGLRW